MIFSRQIWPLSAATFATGTQAYVFAGLLGDMARDLDVPVGVAGRLAAGYAIAFALAAPLAAGWAMRRELRGVMIAALIAVAALNLVSAAVPFFDGLLAARIVAGLAATLVMPIASAAAVALTPVEARGRALAAVAGGTTIAFVLGIPVGSAIGGLYGWRATFVFAAILAILASITIAWRIPSLKLPPRPQSPFSALLRTRGVLSALAAIFLGFAATFTVVSYVGPVVVAITGASGGQVGLYQFWVGIGALAGVPLGGMLVDRGLGHAAPIGVFIVMIATLSGYSLLIGGGSPAFASIALALIILIGAAALFALIPSMQARLVAAAPHAAPILLGVSASVIFLGQGAGAVFGGWIADHVSFKSIGFAGAAVAAAGLLFTLASMRRVAVAPSP